MKPEPLKGKTLETPTDAEFFQKEDIHSACLWLIESMYDINFSTVSWYRKEIEKLIYKAFEDVMK